MEQEPIDNPAKDMLDFAHKYLGIAPTEVQVNFVTDLCAYIAERDHRVMRHGMELVANE